MGREGESQGKPMSKPSSSVTKRLPGGLAPRLLHLPKLSGFPHAFGGLPKRPATLSRGLLVPQPGVSLPGGPPAAVSPPLVF